MPAVTRITNKDSVSIGLAKLYLAPYVVYESSVTSVLGASDYFSALTEIEISANKTFAKRSTVRGNIITTLENILVSSDVGINASFIEMTDANMAIAFGGDGTNPNFMQSLFASPAIMRAEAIFTYPNKINQLHLIFPKVQVITPSVSMSFSAAEAMQIPLRLSVLLSSHANWNANPYGVPVFI